MWQRFTKRARRIILVGQQEADKMGSGHVGTEHLLLGLLLENQCAAALVLEKMGITLDKVRQEIEKETVPQSEPTSDEPRLNAEAIRVLKLAVNEARERQHKTVGTAYLLLAMLREEAGLAARILQRLGLNLEKVRAEVAEHTSEEPEPRPDPGVAEARAPHSSAPRISVATDFLLNPELMTMLGTALFFAKREGSTLITPKNLLQAIVGDSGGEAAQLLKGLGFDLNQARTTLLPPFLTGSDLAD